MQRFTTRLFDWGEYLMEFILCFILLIFSFCLFFDCVMVLSSCKSWYRKKDDSELKMNDNEDEDGFGLNKSNINSTDSEDDTKNKLSS